LYHRYPCYPQTPEIATDRAGRRQPNHGLRHRAVEKRCVRLLPLEVEASAPPGWAERCIRKAPRAKVKLAQESSYGAPLLKRNIAIGIPGVHSTRRELETL